MAHSATLYRFRTDLSDVDRGVYESIDFRIAMHPSESSQYLISRVLAYLLNYQEGIQFSPGGLSDPDEPCIFVPDPSGLHRLWIEIGNPSAKKLHRATKSATEVKVYTYKDPAHLLQEIVANKVHKAEKIEIFPLPSKFLDILANDLERDNKWNVMLSDGTLTVSYRDFSETIELCRYF